MGETFKKPSFIGTRKLLVVGKLPQSVAIYATFHLVGCIKY